jgi:uncharacterized phosphosugar-binding protein
LDKEQVAQQDVAILISNSGRNNVPVEMALELKARGVKVIAITSVEQSRSSVPLHASGKRLFEIADVTIDNCVPPGDALLTIKGLHSRIGPSSTVAGATIINSIVIEAVNETLRRGGDVPVLPSANLDGVTQERLKELLNRYRGRIRYLDLDDRQ